MSKLKVVFCFAKRQLTRFASRLRVLASLCLRGYVRNGVCSQKNCCAVFYREVLIDSRWWFCITQF